MRRKILIAIPGRQHADQLAAALLEAGFDPLLHHGAPLRPSLARPLQRRHRRHTVLGWVFRAGNRLLPPSLAKRLSAHSYALFDRLIAHQINRAPPDAVIGYEEAAQHLFAAARRRGIPTILDAASVHHRLQATAGINDAGTPFRRRVNARKDAEIALADHILCCSALAARSYRDAGVPPGRIHIVPLGFEPKDFATVPATPHAGALRIAFVGRFTAAKGADLLATALEQLSALPLPYVCRIAAAPADGDVTLIARLQSQATLLGKVRHDRLSALYQWADILVMPSRFDSFGLVVPEALACGLPVLASDRVGASDLIQAGVTGAIVPSGDVDALATKLAGYAADPAIVRAMRPAAACSVRNAQWSQYRIHAGALIATILDRTTAR